MPASLLLDFVKNSAVDMGAQAFGLDAPIRNVEFEYVKFHSPVELKSNVDVQLSISIQLSNGNFKVTERSKVLASGSIKCSTNPKSLLDTSKLYKEQDSCSLYADDIYKELRLRGYCYDDQFKSIHSATASGVYGQIKWKNNWAIFLDAMIQFLLFSKDTRALHMPVEIGRILFNIDDHLDEENFCEIYFLKKLSTIVCGGVEVTDVIFNAIERQELDGTEVLQTYKFVPFIDSSIVYDQNDAIKICVDLALEKLQKDHIKLVEVLSSNNKPMIKYFYEIFNTTPSTLADLTLLTEKDKFALVNNDSIKCKSISHFDQYTNYNFVVMNKCMDDGSLSEMGQRNLSDDGFLISIDETHQNMAMPHGFTLISVIKSREVTFTLMQRSSVDLHKTDNLKIIQIEDSGVEQLDWLQNVQESNTKNDVLLVAQNMNASALLELINCLPKPDVNHFKCIIVEDEHAPKFAINNSFYKDQLNLKFPVNIYRDGKWGTYRHLALKDTAIKCESKKRLTADIKQIGDFSSLHWTPQIDFEPSNKVINIQYAALNYRDAMIVNGNMPEIHKSRLDENQSGLGFEFAGVTENGKRVMGATSRGGSLSTHILCEDADIILNVPETMSLRDAATIPFAYFTIYYSFFINNRIKAGQSIWIHAGCGSVGLAAIRVALAYGLNVFTTVSTQQKKEFLLKEFHQLKGKLNELRNFCIFEWFFDLFLFRAKYWKFG